MDRKSIYEFNPCPDQVLAALEAQKQRAISQLPSDVPDKTAVTTTTDREAAAAHGNLTLPTTSKPAPTVKKKKPKQLSAKERKERSVSIKFHLHTSTHLRKLEVDKVVSALPIEFRGSDPVRAPAIRLA